MVLCVSDLRVQISDIALAEVLAAQTIGINQDEKQTSETFANARKGKFSTFITDCFQLTELKAQRIKVSITSSEDLDGKGYFFKEKVKCCNIANSAWQV
ncbi:hypothetical protein TNCV_48771 [Trichonephila clavipes]|nr:hypothetical protein TNCV_48771 [Trichonephila clavipes]